MLALQGRRAGLPAVLPGDLANKCKAKAGPLRARSARTVERREDVLLLARGDALTSVAYRQHGALALAANPNLDRRQSVLLCIFDEVADHPPQQRRVALHDDRLARDIAFRATRDFLGSKRQQIYIFANIEFSYRVEAT